MFSSPLIQKRKPDSFLFLAEREGFEPPVPFSTSVFKTGAIDHSATSPILSVKEMWSFLFDVAKVYLFSEPYKHFQLFFQKKCIFCVFLPKLQLNIANLAFQDSVLRGFDTQKLYPNAFAEKGESNKQQHPCCTFTRDCHPTQPAMTLRLSYFLIKNNHTDPTRGKRHSKADSARLGVKERQVQAGGAAQGGV